jgi:hypothetical protein
VDPVARARGLGDIIVSSRPYDEYRAMFGLTDREVLAGPVLDCPGGAGSFAAEVRDRGGRAVSADPAYATPPTRRPCGSCCASPGRRCGCTR